MTIYNEDNLITLGRMEPDSIDLTVTSPPYDSLRDYKGFPVYDLKRHMKTAKELFRVTKQGGVIVWVVNDSCVNGSETGTSFRQALIFKKAGFNLFDTMIYKKTNMAFPDNARYYQNFEYMFVLSKGMPKTFNPIKDRLNTDFSSKPGKIRTQRAQDGSKKIKIQNNGTDTYGKRFNVWEYSAGYMLSSPDEFVFEHPAVFPERLAMDHILSWSNKGDLVYDPFAGSGTVAKKCIELNRDFIGSEISKEYYDICLKRIAHTSPGLGII